MIPATMPPTEGAEESNERVAHGRLNQAALRSHSPRCFFSLCPQTIPLIALIMPSFSASFLVVLCATRATGALAAASASLIALSASAMSFAVSGSYSGFGFLRASTTALALTFSGRATDFLFVLSACTKLGGGGGTHTSSLACAKAAAQRSFAGFFSDGMLLDRAALGALLGAPLGARNRLALTPTGRQSATIAPE